MSSCQSMHGPRTSAPSSPHAHSRLTASAPCLLFYCATSIAKTLTACNAAPLPAHYGVSSKMRHTWGQYVPQCTSRRSADIVSLLLPSVRSAPAACGRRAVHLPCAAVAQKEQQHGNVCPDPTLVDAHRHGYAYLGPYDGVVGGDVGRPHGSADSLCRWLPPRTG